MKLYNTATKLVENLLAQKDDNLVTIYTCGPTVYDYPHIGNWFTFIRYDLLHRSLRASGYKTKWVMNITDVGHLISDADEGEDKLERGARREGKSAWDIAKYYGDYFTKALVRLNFSEVSKITKATDFITEQINLVKRLDEKGYAYRIDDGVYFDTSKFADYANFAKLDLAHQEDGARVEQNLQKRNHSDFALWKFSPKDKKRDMEWESPWGIGFPGWHLECSAMIHAVLGQPVTIHGGGIDHIPVHHTNEIAQSVCAYDKALALFWFHCNHIQVDGHKMSKSLNNYYTLEDIEAKGYNLQTFRLHVLSGHYRSQSEFSWEGLEATHQRLKRLQAAADLVFQPVNDASTTVEFDKIYEQVLDGLQNDLNSPLAISIIDEVASKVLDSLLDKKASEKYKILLKHLDDILGLQLSIRTDISEQQKSLISTRQQARETKDWKTADSARDSLQEQGIEVRDTPHGPVWYKFA